MAEEQAPMQEAPQQASPVQPAPVQGGTPVWKTVVAVIIDLIVGFFALGYLVAMVTGNTTPEGFSLEGGSALVFFALLAAYFYFGYAVWKKSLGLMIMGIKK